MAGEIDMYGGSNFHMDHSGEDGAAQPTGGSGTVEMYGGSEFHMSHGPVESAQKDGSTKGIDMYGGSEFHMEHGHGMQPYGATKPVDKGTE